MKTPRKCVFFFPQLCISLMNVDVSPSQIQRVSVCVKASCVSVRLEGRRGCSSRKNYKLWKIGWQLRWNTDGRAAAPLSPGIGSEVQFTWGRVCNRAQTGVRISPRSPLWASGGGGSYSSSVWRLQKKQRPAGWPRSPAGQSSSTERLGGGIARGWGWASSFISAREGQVGQRGRGQPIDLELARQFREMSEETGRSGENGNKINLGKGPYEFRERVWNETAPCGQHTHHWDGIRFARGYVYVFVCCVNACPILYVSILSSGQVCVCVSVCVTVTLKKLL